MRCRTFTFLGIFFARDNGEFLYGKIFFVQCIDRFVLNAMMIKAFEEKLDNMYEEQFFLRIFAHWVAMTSVGVTTDVRKNYVPNTGVIAATNESFEQLDEWAYRNGLRLLNRWTKWIELDRNYDCFWVFIPHVLNFLFFNQWSAP